MKLGWGVLTEPQALWIQALKNKYNVRGDIVPNVHHTRNESQTWRFISEVWNLLKQGIFLLIGNGCSIYFWEDSWLPSDTILVDFLGHDIPNDFLQAKIVEFCDDRGGWDYPLFQGFLSNEIIVEIQACPPPNLSRGPDKPIQAFSPYGCFSIKFVYCLLEELHNQDRAPL